MRTDKLLVTTQGVRGGKKHVNRLGMVRASVSKGFNEPTDSIEVEVIMGLGKVVERESAMISIEFSNGAEWTGSFPALQAVLLQGLNKHDNHYTNRSGSPGAWSNQLKG